MHTASKALTALVMTGISVMVNASIALAVGPNIMVNNSFEGGDQQFKLQSAFSIANDAGDAHTGSWEMRANLTQSNNNAYQSFYVWKNTDYTSSIWYKGAGKLTFVVMQGDWSTKLATKVLTATSSWKQAKLDWNSGNSTSAIVACIDDQQSGGTVYLDDVFTGLTDAHDIGFDPHRPKASGFKYLIFDDEFNSTSTIDENTTGNDGFLWYTKQFYGFPPTTPSMYTVANGTLSLLNSPNNWGEVLHTAMPYNNSQGWKGTAFAPGQGLYVEGRIALLNITKENYGASIWMTDVKNTVGVDNGMPGNPGHIEGIENDIMEFDPHWWGTANYASTIHDWLENSKVDVDNDNTTICPPAGTDFSQFHTFAMLWVPASAANNWYGYRQCFFDDVPQTDICWKGNQTYTGVIPETKDSMGNYSFSLGDHRIFNLILGGSQTGNPSLSVDWVHVYAVSPSSKVVVGN